MTSKALVVRGGWDGHQPVEATEVFLPFLERDGYDVRVEESPEVYADADEMAATDLVVQCVTMSQITARAGRRAARGGRGRHRASPAGTAASPTPTATRSDYLQLVGGQFATHPGKEPAERQGGAGGQLPAVHREHHRLGPRAPHHRGHRRLRPRDRAVLGAARRPASTCWPPRRIRRSRGTRGTGRSPRPAIWTRQWGAGRIFVTTPGTASTSWSTRTSAPSSRGACCGRAAPHRHRRARRHLPRSTWRRSPAARRCASPPSPTSTRRGRQAVAAELPGVAAR